MAKTVTGILADVNVQGHVLHVRWVLEGSYWAEVWTTLAIPFHTCSELGLPSETSDAVLWRFCQERSLLLITANRSREGSESLEATIQNEITRDSLPVLTVADPERLRKDKAYAERVAERLLECILDIDNYRGVGRLYLP